jgi:predicted nucleotidyltransferase
MDLGLKETEIEGIRSVLLGFSAVEEAVVYGSRAKGTYRPGSDIDLVLKGYSLSLKDLNPICLALDDLLLPYTFDVSIYERLNDQNLLDHIQRVGRTIYKRVDS